MRPVKDARVAQAHAIDIYVGGRVRARRKAIKISQSELAEKLGLTFQQVQKYERGSNRISASKLYEISKVLAVPVAFFFEGFEEMPAEHSSQGDVHAFLRSASALDLGEAYLHLASDEQRRVVLDLLKAMAPLQA